MNLETEALVCTVLPHGEHGAVVRLLTPEHGVVPGYVRGGRGRRLRPVLQPGNAVAATLRSRVDEQLAALTVELARSRAALALDPAAAAALEWLTGALAALLPERQPYPALHRAADALLDRMAGEDALEWTADLARFELLLLAELGFGLDLTRCAATGAPASAAELTHVSPRSGGAVSAIAAAPWAARLLPLPAFLCRQSAPLSWPEIAQALRLTGYFLDRDLLEGRTRNLLPTRTRLQTLISRRTADANNALD